MLASVVCLVVQVGTGADDDVAGEHGWIAEKGVQRERRSPGVPKQSSKGTIRPVLGVYQRDKLVVQEGPETSSVPGRSGGVEREVVLDEVLGLQITIWQEVTHAPVHHLVQDRGQRALDRVADADDERVG